MAPPMLTSERCSLPESVAARIAQRINSGEIDQGTAYPLSAY